jgi:hypothetical protein
MEKKVIIILSVLVLTGCSFNNKPLKHGDDSIKVVAKHDTIYFGSDKSFISCKDLLLIDSTTVFNNGLIYNTIGKGLNVWIDSLFYSFKFKNTFAAVAATLDQGYSFLYYNGDSLTIEKVAINKPSVKEYKTSRFQVFSIIDSSFNSGYLIKSILFYRVNNDGVLGAKKEYFPQKKKGEKYNFSIGTKCYSDSLVIFRNNTVEYTYK